MKKRKKKIGATDNTDTQTITLELKYPLHHGRTLLQILADWLADREPDALFRVNYSQKVMLISKVDEKKKNKVPRSAGGKKTDRKRKGK